MRFQTPLVPARLIRRYKRFLADMILEEDGREITAHCPNPGAMLGLATPTARCWLEPNDYPQRKLGHAWRLVELADNHMAGIDTMVPNRVVAEALRAGQISNLADAQEIRAEVAYGTRSRIDFLVSDTAGRNIWIEVKNVHLRRSGAWAEFPDCVTARGAKHLRELSLRVGAGDRAVMLYVVQRTDCTSFRIASDLDPAYARAFDAAREAGVEMLAYGTHITRHGVALTTALPVDPAPQAP